MAAGTTTTEGIVVHDLVSLLSSEGRDFLIRNNGDQVKVNSLSGKVVGLYFSGSWCGPCLHFTPNLVEVYQEISGNKNNEVEFEVVFISSDRDEESFNGYFGKMPWLAVPFSEMETRKNLKDLFKVRGIPNLVILDGDGRVCTQQGVSVIYDYGVHGYPFNPEKLNDLREEEERAMKNQSISSLLVHGSRDFVVSNDERKVPISKLEGKTVAIYFSSASHGGCIAFTKKLTDLYKKIKEKGEDFEVVLVSLDYEEQEFKDSFGEMPWLALPFKDKKREKLVKYFELSTLPTLVVIGSDGKTLYSNVAEKIEEHGEEAYPFTPENFARLAEIEKAKLESQTLESILVSPAAADDDHQHKDYVIAKDGSKIPVSELVGKHILLYFSAQWCPPCRAFLPKFISVYEEIKSSKNKEFEVIFISSDRDQSSFDDFFAEMPWLALPFGDERKTYLQKLFKIRGIPACVAISPSGKTSSTQVRQLIQAHGADAFPFTEDHIKKLEDQLEEIAKGWPEKLKNELHSEHELTLVRRSGYGCDGCKEMGHGWSYFCKICDFDLHPNCALKNAKQEQEEQKKEGYICDGDMCRKA